MNAAARIIALPAAGLLFLSAVACDILDSSGPDGPGYFAVELVSPNGGEGSAVFRLVGGGVLEEVIAEEGDAYHQHHGAGSDVVVILDEPGVVRFRVWTRNVGKEPEVTVVQVAGADNVLRTALEGYGVEVTRVKGKKGGAL